VSKQAQEALWQYFLSSGDQRGLQECTKLVWSSGSALVSINVDPG